MYGDTLPVYGWGSSRVATSAMPTAAENATPAATQNCQRL